MAVVTDGGAVLCYDHTLKLLWESSVPLEDGHRVLEAGVVVAPVNVFQVCLPGAAPADDVL